MRETKTPCYFGVSENIVNPKGRPSRIQIGLGGKKEIWLCVPEDTSVTCFHRVLTTPTSSVRAVHRVEVCPGPAGRPRLTKKAGFPQHAGGRSGAPSVHLRLFRGDSACPAPRPSAEAGVSPRMRAYLRLAALHPLRTREEPAHPRAWRTAPLPLVPLVPEPPSCLSNPRAASWGQGSASHSTRTREQWLQVFEIPTVRPENPHPKYRTFERWGWCSPRPGRPRSPHSKPFLTLHIITQQRLQALGVDSAIPSIRPS